MIQDIINLSKKDHKNILIVGSPRSGTHALASLFYQADPTYNYLGEICQAQQGPEPWSDIKRMMSTDKLCLAHVVQTLGKIFLIPKIKEIKKDNIIVYIKRKDKLKQFASWIYFQHIGAIYNFDHFNLDYLDPGSITVSLDDIEKFIIDQSLNHHFFSDFELCYEDIDFSKSKIKKNQYAYPIEQVIKNFDLVKKHLMDWNE